MFGVVGQPAAHADVGRQDRSRVGEALQGLGHRGPHDAVGTARADHPGRLDRGGRPVVALQLDQHTVVAFLDGRGRDAALDHDAELGEPLGEDLLRAPLGKAALELPGTADACVGQLTDLFQVRVDHPGEPHVDRRGQHVLDQPGAGEQLERARLDRGRPGLVVRCGQAVQHPGHHTVARQLGRREQTRRACADDHHLGVGPMRGGRSHVSPPVQRPMPPSMAQTSSVSQPLTRPDDL